MIDWAPMIHSYYAAIIILLLLSQSSKTRQPFAYVLAQCTYNAIQNNIPITYLGLIKFKSLLGLLAAGARANTQDVVTDNFAA